MRTMSQGCSIARSSLAVGAAPGRESHSPPSPLPSTGEGAMAATAGGSLLRDSPPRRPFLQFLCSLAQHELLDLAGGGLGQRAEDHGLGRLEARHVFPAELDDLLLARLGAVLESDEGARRLAPFLVGP